MKESLWGYWIVVLGIAIIAVMVLLQNYTTTGEQDYYLGRECLESAMYESVDYAYMIDSNTNSTLVIDKEKLVENFIRRFAQSVDMTKNYTINFYKISEDPPYVSVQIITKSGTGTIGNNTDNHDVVENLTGILYTSENAGIPETRGE